MQIKITEDTAWAFEDMVPQEILYPIDRMGRYSIGEVRSIEGEETALGILVFELKEGFKQSEIQLQWIYVAEGFREQGIGQSLLKSFFNIVNNIDHKFISDVCCKIPNGDEYSNLCQFFEKNGFVFETTEDNAVEVSMSRVKECSFVKKEIIDERVTSIGTLTYGQWQKICDLIEKTEAGFDRNIDAYEKKVSSVVLIDRIPVAILLFQKNGANQLQVSIISCTSKNKASEIALLIAYSIQMAQTIYGEEVSFKLVCDNQYITSFVEKFFPEIAYRPVKFGHYCYSKVV